MQRRRERKVSQNSQAESTKPAKAEKVRGPAANMSGRNVLILQSIEGGSRGPKGTRGEKEEKERENSTRGYWR